ncbi:hypothetical protein CALCODRAFT_129977 [Calocera cornea HHB12733]|uniref:Uncharacterized protein n=1 Tax=Calocera cornea HHB12733 TaxID=1353952 RepID=A0A165IAA3_9BASI|nr:hypothetical protein CALCODRAFT_129977 [Calocera cornea HHB12733]
MVSRDQFCKSRYSTQHGIGQRMDRVLYSTCRYSTVVDMRLDMRPDPIQYRQPDLPLRMCSVGSGAALGAHRHRRVPARLDDYLSADCRSRDK